MDATSHPERVLIGEKEEQPHKEGCKHREQKSHRGGRQEAYSCHGALHGRYNPTAALSPPLSKLGKPLRRPSMPSTCPRSPTLFCMASKDISMHPHPPARASRRSQQHSSYTEWFIYNSSGGGRDHEETNMIAWIHVRWIIKAEFTENPNGDIPAGCLHHSGVRNQSPAVNIRTLGCLPDFKLSELWLRPRISTVDLGEVESVRLKVDVHVVQQTRSSVLFCNRKR